MGEEEKTVTNISIRAAYDSLEEILGKNARNIIMRNAGLHRAIESPPDYTWDKEFTNREQLSIYQEAAKLIGKVGIQGVFRQIGFRSAEITIVKFKVLDSIKELPPDEKFDRCLEFLTSAINRGRLVKIANGTSAFDNFDCTACEGIESTKPYCSQYTGTIQFLSDWSYGKGEYIAEEVKCKAVGDETCLFELKKK